MYFTAQQSWELTHTMTDYLAEREQLMHDIECIVDAFFYEKYNGDVAEGDELTRILCDAVCKNFPTN